MLSFLVSVLLPIVGVAAETKFYTLNVTNAKVNPDGFVRSAITVDGSLRAPLLSANVNDDFSITVNNRLTDEGMNKSTSIHWHGIVQHRTAEMDGVAFVNQCPISPNHGFTYQFPTQGQTGTYWYHSHYLTQYCDGLRGPLVIYDPNDPHRYLYDVDNADTVITFAEWYHSYAPVVAAASSPPTPNTTLINGHGRYPNNTSARLSVIRVTHGKSYRMRLVNMACDPSYLVTFEGHALTVIEADGVETKRHVVNSLTIFPGQRYSVVLHANQSIGNYWIRASPSGGPQGFVGGINSAILRYEGACDAEPTGTNQTEGTTLLEQDLIPWSDPTPPGGSNPANRSYVFDIGVNNSTNQFTINGFTYESPSVPVLLQILNGVNPQDLLPNGTVFVLPRNEVIQVAIPGGSSGAPHPFHLHGHRFSVIRSAGQSGYNYLDPVQRDVVSTGASTSDLTTIRFKTDNPGPWILHCHIDWHLGRGLAIVFAEDPAGQVKGSQSVHHNKEWDQLCPIYNSLPASDH